MNRIAWFNTSQCISGYNLYPATEEERKQFNCTHKVESFHYKDDNILNWTSLVKIIDNKLYFIDNDVFENDNMIKYQRPINIQKFININ